MELTSNVNKELFGVVLFCGIPASGKSTFIKEVICLNDKFLKDYKIIYLNFDSFFQNIKIEKTENLEYKKEMDNFYAYCIETINNKIKSKIKNEIIFIEDNLPLKSSRKIFYNLIYDSIQLYIEDMICFTEIIFNTSQEVCIYLNSIRDNNVPDYIIKSMSVFDNSTFAKNSFNITLTKNEDSKISRKIYANFENKIIDITDFELFFFYLIESLIQNRTYIVNLIEKNNVLEENRKMNDNKDYTAKLLDKLELTLKHYISQIVSNDESKVNKIKEISKIKADFYNTSKVLIKHIKLNNADNKDNIYKYNFYNSESIERLKILMLSDNNLDSKIEFLLGIFKNIVDKI